MRWASAISEDPNLDAAVASMTHEVLGRMNGLPIHLAALFVSHHFGSRYVDLHEVLRKSLPHERLIGCSAGGVIGAGHEIEDRPGISLTVAHLPGVSILPFSLDASRLPDDDESPKAWHRAVRIEPEPVSAFILVADPFTFPVPKLLAGLDYAYPGSVKIGGLASGAQRPGGNVLYLDDTIHRSGLAGVALAGNVEVETIVAQGCRPIGEPIPITRCDRNVILELDGRPALDVVREVLQGLSGRSRELAAQSLFLGVSMDEFQDQPTPGEFLIRNIVGVDPQRGAIAVGELPREGQIVQLHVRDAESSASDLRALLGRYAEGSGARGAKGALLFSCLGRGEHLYGLPDHDTKNFIQYVGRVPIGGFFCSGEIGPVGGVTHLHGYTSAFGIFREREG
jgi:small ligand-binding sensory domain FIST